MSLFTAPSISFSPARCVRLVFTGASACITIATAPLASAETPGTLSIGPKLSTVGVGLEATWRLSDHFVLRAGPNWLNFDTDSNISGIAYDAEVDFLTGSAFVDWHPFGNGFRTSVGFVAGRNDVNIDATPNQSITIGGTSYTPAEVGSLAGTADLNSFNPFVGIGWSSGHDKREGLQFFLDAGVKFGGKPDVALQSQGGTLSGDPSLTSSLALEASDVEDDINVLRYYPVIQLGLSYRF